MALAFLSSLSEVVLNLIAALVIVLFGLVAGTLLGKLVKRVLHSFEIDAILSREGIAFPLEKSVASIVRYLVYFMGVVWALNQLGLATAIVEIILAMVLIIFVAIIILGLKDFIPNITAGFFIHSKRNLNVGDKIRVANIEGEILEVDLIETKIRAGNGDIILIPNNVLTKNEVEVLKK
ncbi:mechanosensitive ion channel [Candidatus Woesearchaeota archaeon]|nr:mechanosensitive ion channel [Candidatus Woesearchaeota archaeon]